MSQADAIVKLGESLRKEAIDNPSPSVETCEDLLDALSKEQMNTALLEKSKIGKTLTKAIKAFKRHKRSEGGAWGDLLQKSEGVIKSWKETADKEAAATVSSAKQKKQQSADLGREGLPKTSAEYRARLVKYNKDLYKDPPVLPPPSINTEDTNYGEPKRDDQTKELTFKPGKCSEANKLMKQFHPNRTPEEVMRAGAFGGTYYRAIRSGVTNVSYNPSDVLKDSVKPEWIQGLDKKTMLTSATYKNHVNKYGVKCGGSLGMWESSGWITDSDPYGWFQWYCRFYQGRRCEDDARQISRWLKSAGLKGRFRSQLCNKIIAANTRPDDNSISPVIRQTLLHWGLEITEDILQKHKNRK